jgi:hypothetical protein
MRHDWVFDVLSDLLAYATRNDLPGLAAKVSAAIDEARREIDAPPPELADDPADDPEEPPQSPPPSGRQMH